jgi:redox-sensing transcriptional repressor
MVAAGVSSILNFAPAIVTVPDGMSLRKVDLAVELQILSYYEQQREPALSALPSQSGEALGGPVSA